MSPIQYNHDTFSTECSLAQNDQGVVMVDGWTLVPEESTDQRKPLKMFGEPRDSCGTALNAYSSLVQFAQFYRQR